MSFENFHRIYPSLSILKYLDARNNNISNVNDDLKSINK